MRISIQRAIGLYIRTKKRICLRLFTLNCGSAKIECMSYRTYWHNCYSKLKIV